MAWHILRFSGYIRNKDGTPIGIANTAAELWAIRAETGLADELTFTSPGFHDEQVTAQEFFAWHRRHLIESAGRITEARGRPKPGAEHPHAEPDDPDGVHGGMNHEEIEFGAEDGLPGGDKDADAVDELRGQSDPALKYTARHPLTEEQLFEAVHRRSRAPTSQYEVAES